MQNLALNKVPFEAENWTRPEIATNGNIDDYNGSKGFSYAKWPCTYTLDLESRYLIKLIRVLIWDGLGSGSVEIDSRKYKFSISISLDGNDFQEIFTNKDEDGGNGWFTLHFLNDTNARFIKLQGIHNSVNKDFHLVELQAFDEVPPAINSINEHTIMLLTSLPDKENIQNIVDQSIERRSKIIGDLEEKAGSLEGARKSYQEAVELVEIIKKSGGYQDEAEENGKRAENWLIASGVTFLVFIITILLFLICGNKWTTSIITKAAENYVVYDYTRLFLTAFYITKALIISTILFVFTWFLKNYRSEKHNYVVNKHKAMSLAVATKILTDEDYKGVERGSVFLQAMNIVFQHQISGYSKEDQESPSVINQLLTKGMTAVNDGQ